MSERERLTVSHVLSLATASIAGQLMAGQKVQLEIGRQFVEQSVMQMMVMLMMMTDAGHRLRIHQSFVEQFQFALQIARLGFMIFGG